MVLFVVAQVGVEEHGIESSAASDAQLSFAFGPCLSAKANVSPLCLPLLGAGVVAFCP